MNKPREVEGVLDLYLIRPIGGLFALSLRGSRVTPNMLSIASVGVGLLAAIAYYHDGYAGALGGLFFMLLTSALDSADGQLARLTDRHTDNGAVLDGVCDNLTFAAIYLGILFSYLDRGGGWGMFFVAAAAGLSHSTQSALADFQRRLFRYYCLGKKGKELRLPEEIEGDLCRMKAQNEAPLGRLLTRLLLNYSRQERFFLKSSDALQRLYEKKTDLPIREAFAKQYREAVFPLLRWWAFMAPNTHKVGLVVIGFIPILFPAGPLHEAGMALFYLYNLLLNLPMLMLIAAQRRVDRRLMGFLE